MDDDKATMWDWLTAFFAILIAVTLLWLAFDRGWF